MEAKVKPLSNMEKPVIKTISDWSVCRQKPLVISGPCSAETEEQVMETAKQLSAGGKCDVFRAGVWKPRTKPGGFEGIGCSSLRWLKRVRKECQLPVAVEVAREKHVYEALKHGIDILWIGARTTTNPFSIQEIADTLKGVDVTVLVKNPVNPDVDLWMGAIERINKAGVNRIGAVHRGFFCCENEPYRNTPKWQIPMELRRRMPQLPMICDPSHMSGKPGYLQEIAQKAMDLGFEGLMIESHIQPENAWSDSGQQIKPAELVSLLESLASEPENEKVDFSSRLLNELREQIDIFDDQIMDMLERRFRVAEKIGAEKRKKDIPFLQSARRSEIIGKAVKKGEGRGLDRDFVKQLFSLIHSESLNRQMKTK